MLEEASSICSDVSVVRRLCFVASAFLKIFLTTVTEFGFQFSANTPSTEDVQVLLENMSYMEKSAFNRNSCLEKELIDHCGFEGHPLGIILISSNETCNMCSGKLVFE